MTYGTKKHTPPAILVKESEFRSATEKYITYVLVIIGFAVVAAFAWWWFTKEHIPQNFTGRWHMLDMALFATLSYVVWYQVVNEMMSWEIALWMRKPRYMSPEEGLRVALLTAFVPGKEPYDVLENTLTKMVAVEYPHDTWLLDEGDDREAKRICEKLGVLHYSRHGKEHFNTLDGKFKRKTKAGNYNSWFHNFSGNYDIVAQHDVDFAPTPQYLMRTLGYFRDPHVAFVGTPQIYGNIDESWIAKGAAEQAYGFYGSMQKGLFGHDMHLFIGANHIIRIAAHDDIGGYAGHIVEDHLTGMRLYRNNWKGVYVAEELLVGEGPATWAAYFSQQMRWAYGLIDILFRHSPRLMPRMRLRHSFHYLLLQQYYFYGLAQMLGIFLLFLYFTLGVNATRMQLQELLTYYPSFLLMQILIFLWLQRFYVNQKVESGLHLRGKLLNIAAGPIYFLAFIGALTGRRLTYEVTPKGAAQSENIPPSPGLFIWHGVWGTVTAFGILVGVYAGHAAPQLVFWAVLNTLCMYYFLASAMTQNVLQRMSRTNFSRGNFLKKHAI